MTLETSEQKKKTKDCAFKRKQNVDFLMLDQTLFFSFKVDDYIKYQGALILNCFCCTFLVGFYKPI